MGPSIPLNTYFGHPTYFSRVNHSFYQIPLTLQASVMEPVWYLCGSPPGVIVADTLSFNAKIGVVDF